MSAELAIVIPAWKPHYLADAVSSVLRQTEKRFNLYVFDDCSPHGLKKILEKSGALSQLNYHRFDENVGQQSVVRQWNRCLNMLNGEKWIWLFSDDDVMDPGCVEAFYKAVSASDEHPAFRFHTKKISPDGQVIRVNQFPDQFDQARFLNLKLSYTQESYIVEYIFSRKAYMQVGGIPELPLAWASDDLFISRLAARGTIKTIRGPYVYWRYGNNNISGKKSNRSALLKMEASQKFVKQITESAKSKRKIQPADLPSAWYVRQIRSLEGQLSIWQELRLVYQVRDKLPNVWRHYLKMKKERSKLIGWLQRFFS